MGNKLRHVSTKPIFGLCRLYLFEMQEIRNK